MSVDARKNFALSFIGVGPSPAGSGETLTLIAGGAARMPATPFNATCWPPGVAPLAENAEIVRVTNVVPSPLSLPLERNLKLMDPLSYTGHRVLAHLPVWAENEPAHIEAEGGAELSIRAYQLSTFTVRLLEDKATPDMTEGQVQAVLAELAAAGLCVESPEGWRMTEAGLHVLTDPVEKDDNTTTPGPAFVQLHPAEGLSEGGEA